jgi:hypothetical protein
MNHILAAALLLASAAASSQTTTPAPMPTEFPPGAQPVTAAQISERLKGQTFKSTLSNGVVWRMEHNNSGYMFADISTGGRNTAKWHAEDGRACYEFRLSPVACSEVRLVGDKLYLKRSSTGEVIALDRQ